MKQDPKEVASQQKREIKFRAWDKGHNKMVYKVNLYSLGHPSGKMNKAQLDNKQAMNSIGFDCEVMQYTGLKDKNGKEIYEGDILVINKGDDEWKDFVKGDKNFLELSTYKNKCVTSCSLYEMHKQLEVMGNIYENPELIK